MRLHTEGSFKDHNGSLVLYRLVREQRDDMPVWWHCQIDPHGIGEWNAAGAGRNHADALKTARQWWKEFDAN